jgi:heavy metal sensor kinase
MSLGNKHSLFNTLTFRLTLSYAGLFVLSSLIIVVVIYFTLKSNMRERVDRMLRVEAEEVIALYDTHGLEGVRLDFAPDNKTEEAGDVFDRVLAPDGAVLAINDPLLWRGVEINRPSFDHIAAGQLVFATLPVSGDRHKVRVGCARLNDGNILQLAKKLGDEERILDDYSEVSTTVIAIVLGLATLVGWLTARSAMAGIESVALAATHLGQGNLSQRVPLRGRGDEVDHLAESFNGMAERIEVLVKELKEVTSNIAHDLRSPITRMRGLAEAAMADADKPGACGELAADVIEESDRLIGLINTMLEIAETESGAAQFSRSPVDLGEVARNAIELFQPVAEDKAIHFELAVSPGDTTIPGDTARLQRVVANLLDNAIKYTPADGSVRLAVSGNPAEVILAVTDTGIGIAEKDLERIFDRFYRGDPSRSTSGFGLGLSLTRALVKAHGGVIEVRSFPGKGSTFTVRLPRLVTSR